MRQRRIITLILAGLLAGASAVPALAETEEKPKGLERARQMTQQALDLAAGDADEAPPAVPPGQAKEKPGKGPGKNGVAMGNPHNDAIEKATGRARAAAAIASALALENGNGNAFGRGNTLQVLLAGDTPDSLETDENHGAEVSAMVRAYNELKARDRAGD